ncbi:hypothetical protein F4677DRAFT_462784 [Hypoxylon crocopeplum]|nr:hypothetical protein F4677DRAFT_462784 [Hypoxylon crocopeplum]
MSLTTLAASCLCSQSTKRSGSVLRQALAGHRPTRSGKCAVCGIARHREGKVFHNQPKHKEHISEAEERGSYLRGYHDDNISCRLSIVQIVAQFTMGLEHDEEIYLAERVYIQLKMEGSPLVDHWWEGIAHMLPDEVWNRLHVIMSDQLGPSYKYHVRKGR